MEWISMAVRKIGPGPPVGEEVTVRVGSKTWVKWRGGMGRRGEEEEWEEGGGGAVEGVSIEEGRGGEGKGEEESKLL